MYFQKLNLDNISEFRKFFNYIPTLTCDYTVGGLFIWRDFFCFEYFYQNNVFFTRIYSENEFFYNLPMGVNLLENIKKIILEDINQTVKFFTIPEEYVDFFKNNFKVINVVEQVDFEDYLYDIRDLSTLKGKKFSGQRNLIHQFIRENAVWSFEKITPKTIKDVIRFYDNEYKIDKNAQKYEVEEYIKTREVLENIDLYAFFGYFLTTNGKIVGFSLGEIKNDTLFVHIEKANKLIKGAYQMLVNQFVIKFQDKVKFVNREEDMGDLGLKTSKESYHPIKKLKKYIIEISK